MLKCSMMIIELAITSLANKIVDHCAGQWPRRIRILVSSMKEAHAEEKTTAHDKERMEVEVQTNRFISSVSVGTSAR